ncbi:MAG: hypothetical protein ACFCVC_13680 [Acidimicrobiia bacterium]
MTQHSTGDTHTADESTADTLRVSAKTEAHRLSEEAKSQARNVYDEVGGRMREEADSQSHRAADGLRNLSQELDTMASSTEGMASSWVREGSTRIASFADRLDIEGIDGITADIQRYARRRPGMFLAATFGAGLVVSRVIKNADTRSIAESGSTTQQTSQGTGYSNGDRWTGPQPVGHEPDLIPDPFVDPGIVR